MNYKFRNTFLNMNPSFYNDHVLFSFFIAALENFSQRLSFSNNDSMRAAKKEYA